MRRFPRAQKNSGFGNRLPALKNNNFFRRFLYALTGLKISWRSERSFRTHVVGAAFVLIVLLVTRPAPVWWAILFLVSGSVIALEVINTAVEKLIDHVHPDQHAIIGIVKDTLAGAVLVMSATALLVFAAFLWAQFYPMLTAP
jgi:diacylglycerol kinase (ATP)